MNIINFCIPNFTMKSENSFLEKTTKTMGYLFGYFLFKILLFLILNRLQNWNYFHIMGLTLLIVFIGTLLKKLLK